MTEPTYSERLQPILKLGMPTRGFDWMDYEKEFSLTSADEPELLRMAQDEDLHQLNHKNPAVFAPLHAIRALKQVGTEAMFVPLVELLEQDEDDDWIAVDIPRTLAKLGKAILPEVELFLHDVANNEWARHSLTSFYTDCYEQHPDLQAVLADRARTLLADFDHFCPNLMRSSFVS